MARPALSIILPFRNANAFLERALRSCLEQTHEDLELIAVNDASTDESPKLAAAMANRDKRLRLLHHSEHQGVSAAFQTGLDQANAPLIARMDADDRALPDKFARQIALLNENPDLAGVSCRVKIEKFQGTDQPPAPADGGYQRFESWLNQWIEPEEIAAQRFVDSPLVNPTMVVRRSILEPGPAYQTPDWAEDYDLWLRLLEKGHRFAKHPDVLFHWSDHPSRITRIEDIYSQEAFQRCKAHYLSRLPAVQTRGVEIAGAGPGGKRMARYLMAKNITVKAFYEVHPRRIGQSLQGLPIRGNDEWPPATPTCPVVLAAVGQEGKRQVISELAKERGYTIGDDFFPVA